MTHTLRSTTAAAAIAATLALAIPAGAAERTAAPRPRALAYLDAARLWLGDLLGGLDLRRVELRSTSGDVGPVIDPDGLNTPPPGSGQVGPYIDPDGSPKADLGPGLDPNG